MSAVAVGISRRNCEPRTTDFLMSASMLLTSRRTEDLRTLVRTFSVRSPMTISESGLMRSTLPSSKPTSARALEKVRTRSPLASRIPSCPPFQARSVERWISTRPEMKVRVAKRCSTSSAFVRRRGDQGDALVDRAAHERDDPPDDALGALANGSRRRCRRRRAPGASRIAPQTLTAKYEIRIRRQPKRLSSLLLESGLRGSGLG